MTTKIDFETFVETQNILDGFDTPKLHVKIIQWLIDTAQEPDRLLQVFRGAGKSHIVALYVVWLLINDPNTTIIVMSAKQELAADNARHIRRVIEENPFAKHLRGDDKWTDHKFYVARTANTRNASVACSSLESDNVGTRCDVMIIDDLETDKNSQTEKQRSDMRAAIAEFMTIAKRQRLYIGTPHAMDSIYSHLHELDYPRLQLPWTPDIWPDHPDQQFTQEWADRYQKQNPAWKWNSQYLLIPDSPDSTVFETGLIKQYSDDLKVQDVWGPTPETDSQHVTIGTAEIVDYAAYWDPATGLTGRDNSTFAVVFKDANNSIYLHRLEVLPAKDSVHGYGKQCAKIVEVCKELGLQRVIVEGTQATTLDTELKQAAKNAGVWIHVKRKARTARKTTFIAEHLEPTISALKFYAHSSVPQLFYSELHDFPNAQHDDAIDATAGAVSELRGDVITLGKANPISATVSASRIYTPQRGNVLSRFS